MFEKASRMKLRFEYRGAISVEDLWDLSVEALDGIYASLCAQKKSVNEDSLLKRATKEDRVRDLKIGLVKHIVEVKLQEAKDRESRAVAKLQREKIAAIIEKKEDASLEEMSIEDLKKTMSELS